MPTLTRDQIAMYAQAAGLTGAAVDTAVAVALAESGGNTKAHNAIPPDDSYGLWQINMLGSMGPERRRKLGISSNSALYDPAVNARAMAMISSGGSNFTPWSTYTSGAYRKHLSGGAGGVESANWLDDLGNGLDGVFDWGSDAFTGIADGLKGLLSIAELMIGAAAWMANPHNWIRVVQVGTGGVLVAVGIVIAARGALKPAAAAVGKVAPAGGKILKAVS